MKKIILIPIIVVLTSVAVLGYLGFVPGLSDVITPPRDLGIRYSEADLLTAYDKAGRYTYTLPNGSVVINYSGEIDTQFTNEEISALVTLHPRTYNPIKDAQFKFNDDGTIESSGKLDTKYLAEFSDRFKLRIPDEATDALKNMPGSPRFYIKGTGSVMDDDADFEVEELEIGRLQVPVEDAGNGLEDATENYIDSMDDAHLTSATIEDGALQFDGMFPRATP